VIDDIDPRDRARLKDAGIEKLPQLLDRSPDDLAETLADADADVSRERAADWLSEARGLASLLADRDADLPVELVHGIGPTFGSRLREAGLGDLSDLAAASPEEAAELASTDAVTVSADRAAEWLEQAASHLQAAESGDQPELHSEVDRIDAAGTTEGASADDAPQSDTAESDGGTHE
jgi:predicted flap endonuclease-1-like 5' DNA nuclease